MRHIMPELVNFKILCCRFDNSPIGMINSVLKADIIVAVFYFLAGMIIVGITSMGFTTFTKKDIAKFVLQIACSTYGIYCIVLRCKSKSYNQNGTLIRPVAIWKMVRVFFLSTKQFLDLGGRIISVIDYTSDVSEDHDEFSDRHHAGDTQFFFDCCIALTRISCNIWQLYMTPMIDKSVKELKKVEAAKKESENKETNDKKEEIGGNGELEIGGNGELEIGGNSELSISNHKMEILDYSRSRKLEESSLPEISESDSKNDKGDGFESYDLDQNLGEIQKKAFSEFSVVLDNKGIDKKVDSGSLISIKQPYSSPDFDKKEAFWINEENPGEYKRSQHKKATAIKDEILEGFQESIHEKKIGFEDEIVEKMAIRKLSQNCANKLLAGNVFSNKFKKMMN